MISSGKPRSGTLVTTPVFWRLVRIQRPVSEGRRAQYLAFRRFLMINVRKAGVAGKQEKVTNPCDTFNINIQFGEPVQLIFVQDKGVSTIFSFILIPTNGSLG
jgi:hypothetical protein